jgi:uncharacterized protein YkwD
MLVPLFFATTLLAQISGHSVSSPAVRPAAKTSLSFTITIPPIPSFGTDTLHLDPSRLLIPLKAALTLDGPEEIPREEEDLVTAINTERTSRGLDPLTLDPLLREAACDHCREMCELNYFDHRSPTRGETTPVDRYLDELHADGEKRPSAALVGENIFFASVTNDVYNAEYAHQSLMASPSHRENILEPRFTKVGVGLYRDPQGRFWVTEMFLGDS